MSSYFWFLEDGLFKYEYLIMRNLFYIKTSECTASITILIPF